MLANLKKAQAAPKDRVYRSTKKRRAANLANLQKASGAQRTPPQSRAEQNRNLL